MTALPVDLVWLCWSLAFLLPWLALYVAFERHRAAMLRVSLFTMPFGLTEPLFVPEYWSPPSLFDLALRTGFDIESLVFCFGIGGVGAVLYNVISGTRLVGVDAAYRASPLHRHHRLAMASPFIAFVPLYFLPWNVIYAAIAAMTVGGVATLLCRPDLRTTTWLGAVLFTGYYWNFMQGLNWLHPGYVDAVWNHAALSGWRIGDVPLEELLFAAAFGWYWAGVYGHYTWQRPEPLVPAI